MISREIPAACLAGLLTTERGLSDTEVAARRAEFGGNDILVPGPAAWRVLLRDTAQDPMIWFLVGMSVLYAVIGEYRDAVILLLALIPLIGMDMYLHRRTMASTQGLARRLAATSHVLRDGKLMRVAARDLVPGDLVQVAPGDLVPADAIVLSGNDLQVDESSLTGEAYPVRKSSLTALQPAGAEDRNPWVLAGTRLLAGAASIRIAYTGANTLYGEIARSAMISSHAKTALQAAIGRLVGVLLIIALVICGVLAAVRLWQGYGVLDATMSALTLAVAAIPEEFPVVFTFYLGVGVYRLAQRQALVRRAVAIENIGRVTCICSDKTGTMTEGRLTLAHSAPGPGRDDQALIRMAAQVADPTSNDPLDVALLAGRSNDDDPASSLPSLARFAFTEARRRECAVLTDMDGSCLVLVKGAPETVLDMCGEDAAAKAAWLEKVIAFAEGGHKVIACAAQRLARSDWDGKEPETGFAFAGLLAFEDRLRDGVATAVAACREAGIRVVIVTGDHPVTAMAIGWETGLGQGNPLDAPKVTTADQLLAPGADPALLKTVDVIARATPVQKLALVQALQQTGEIVAVTGDGINDVPALQTADIGIAMGERGTQSARETAAIVLLDDNFRTIVRAIAEGRQLFDNLSTSFAYLLMVYIPLVASAAIVPLLGFPLLYLPIHIVWLEFIIHPTAMLVFQDLARADGKIPRRPRGPARFFSAREGIIVGTTGAVIAILVSGLFLIGIEQQMGTAYARSLAIVCLIVASAAMTAGLSYPGSKIGWIVILTSVASAVMLVQVDALASWAHLQPLSGAHWLYTALAGLGGGSLALLLRRRRNHRR